MRSRLSTGSCKGIRQCLTLVLSGRGGVACLGLWRLISIINSLLSSMFLDVHVSCVFTNITHVHPCNPPHCFLCLRHMPSHGSALRKGDRIVWFADASNPRVRPIALARTYYKQTTMPIAALVRRCMWFSPIQRIDHVMHSAQCNYSFVNAPMVVTGTFRTMDLQLDKLASVARNMGTWST